MNTAEPAILIPVYQPSAEFIPFISSLEKSFPDHAIIIVNDGSGENYNSIFAELKNYPVELLNHAENQGKGAALKTGMAYWLKQNPKAGVITVDADGQHTVPDILRLYQAYKDQPDKFHIGARNFGREDIPWRSRIGNSLTAVLFRAIFKLKLRDTQSGLRVIPAGLARKSLDIRQNRYDFEFEMLLLARKMGLFIQETGISTIYIDHNRSSHFNPVIDSLRIYFVFLRFFSSSLLAASLDFIIFALIYYFSDNILLSIIVGRLVSGSFNYGFNYRVTFNSKSRMHHALLKYIVLAIFLMTCSYTGIRLLHVLHINVYLAKIIVESLLYFGSYHIQKRFVFFHSS